LAEPKNILAEPLGSAKPRLKNTALDVTLKKHNELDLDYKVKINTYFLKKQRISFILTPQTFRTIHKFIFRK
jgi:hypothetical protein